MDVCSRTDICPEVSINIQGISAKPGGGLIKCGERASKDAVIGCPAVACKNIKAVPSVTIELGTGSTMKEKPCGNSHHIEFLIRPL